MMTEFTKDKLPTVGMTVVDEDGNIGTVSEVADSHNVRVEYKDGGFGLYCLEPACIAEYSALLEYIND